VEGNQNKNTIEVFDENIIIQEGKKKFEETAGYERSSRLRKYAIEYFTKENKINCHCCSFNFSDFYGKELGRGFIEIHHKKPIFKYKDDDIENTLAGRF
jgi:predicted HNH restriction endonuclease